MPESESENKYHSSYCNSPVNTSCMHIHYKFKEYNWELIVNTNDKLVYVKPEHYNDCDEFKIEFSHNKIFVTIPVLGENMSYKTHFNSYFMAYEYISLHLDNYETNVNNVYPVMQANYTRGFDSF
jgi:hypothetical protein